MSETSLARSSGRITQSAELEAQLEWLREKAVKTEAAATSDASPSQSSTTFNRLNRSLVQLQRKAAEAAIQVEKKQAETPLQLFLPGFDIGAFPNRLNRSSLIAPIACGPRKFHRQAVMVTRGNCVLEYTGEQLDESDCDLIMALIAFAQPFLFGNPVLLNRKQLLRAIKSGRIGSSQYDWLRRSMKRLREATLFLEARKRDGSLHYVVGKMVSFNILKDLSFNGDSETYTYTLDPRWVLMFGNREYSLINWEKRMRISRGLNMAKTLQRLLGVHNARELLAVDRVRFRYLKGVGDKIRKEIRLGAPELRVKDIQDRVRGRYPEASALPDRPSLDRLLEEAGAPLTWDITAADGRGAYRLATLGRGQTAGTTTQFSRLATIQTSYVMGEGDAAQAAVVEERLVRSLEQGGLLVLTVHPRIARHAEAELLHRFSVSAAPSSSAIKRINVDALLLTALREQAQAMKVDWSVVLQADAADRGSRNWVNLQRLVQRAVPAVRAALLNSPSPILLVCVGLLARYELMSLVTELEEHAGRPGHTPSAWVLLPTSHQGLPVIDGVAVPLVNNINNTRAVALPQAWVENKHRAKAGQSAGSHASSSAA